MNANSNKEYSVDISLRDLAAPLFRRKRALVITFLAAFLAVILAGILRPSQYTSHMAVLVNRERLDPLVTTQSTTQLVTTNDPVTKEEINSEAELLKSRDLLEQVVLANGLQNEGSHSLLNLLRPKQSEADKVERAVRSLAKTLKVEPAVDTNMIDVTYSSSDPQVSYNVLKSLSGLYMEKHVEVHRPPGSYEFFAQETQKYHQALEDSESRLKNFNQQPGAAAPDLERADMATQVAVSFGQLHQAREAVAADQQRIRSDQAQMSATPQRSATKQDINSANLLLQNLGTSLLAAETKRTQLLAKYDPNYPLVKEADQEVADAQAAIAAAEKNPYVDQETDRDPTYELLREDLAKTESDLAAQRASVAAIQNSTQKMQSQMADLDQKSVAQQDLLRDVKANEDNYLLYLSKREQERTSDALDKTRIANVAIAVPPAIAALPDHGFPIVALFGLLFGIVLSLTVAYGMEYFDSSFHTPAQVVDMLGIPVVVAVPRKTA
jgi:uncharacterized protein involved in exopolysaccharide biosynthesis